MLRLVLCCLFGVLLTLVSAVQPENCPEDYHVLCRTDYRYRLSHDWIPYANASSGDGIRWRVLVDQYDYQNIFGQFSIPRGVWLAKDMDGDRLSWVHGSGGTCTYALRTNSYRNPNANNWYFTQAISYCDAVELIVNASVRFSACTQRPNCIHDYVYLHRFDTNSPNEDERVKTNNYRYFLENRTASQLKQDGIVGDTQIVKYFPRPHTSHTYFGFQDIGTTGNVLRFMVYYKVCQKNQNGLVIYPEVPLPPHTSGPNDKTMRLAQCVDHAHNITSLETYAYNDRCEQNVMCECDAGYGRSGDSTACIPCTKGYYKSSQNSTCVLCPKNTKDDKEAADHCECADGYYRAPNEGVGMMCTAPPDPIPGELRIVGTCDTTVDLEWNRPAEVGRNDFYYSVYRTNPDSNEEIMINAKYTDTSNIVTFRVSGLASKTTYQFSVCVHNGVSQFDQINDKLRVVAQQATTRQGSVFMHNNMVLPNNSVVLREEIGEGDEALICQTLSDAECGNSASPAVFFPNKTEVLSGENGQTMYSTTGSGLVRLNRKQKDKSPLGLYCCQIPDSEGNIQKMFIKIASIKEQTCSLPDPIRCPVLQNPDHGTVSHNSTSPGSIATYRCTNGTVTMRFCTGDGLWTGAAPICESPSVPTPTTMPLTTMQPTTEPPPTSGLRFELKGKTYANGSKISVDDIGEDNNALLCYTSRSDCCQGANRRGEFYYPDGSKVGIKNNNGPMYRNRGTQLIRLNKNSNSPSPTPTGWYRCEIPNTNGEKTSISINIEAASGGPVCPQLGDPAGGSVTVTADMPYVPGSIATYTCDVGRRLRGSSVRECKNDGTWNQSEPTCELITCPDLSQPDNGNVVQFGNTLGSQAIYSCDNGFELSNENQRTCGRNGQWTGEAPVCNLINRCPALDHPENGLVTINGDNSPGSMAIYSCNGGHSLLGLSTRQCQPNGIWSNEPPTCVNIGFQLNGQFYASNSTLSLSSIGEGESALQCVTDANCCTPPYRAGEFYYPNGNLVRTQGSNEDFYRNRGNGMIRLNRRNSATSPTGTYKCEIPDSNGDIRAVFITLN